MSDNVLELELFDNAYKSATAALTRGDTDTARKYFMRAADIMNSLAEKSEPPLSETRKARAEKLRYIADNLDDTAMGRIEKDGASAEETESRFIDTQKRPTESVSFDDIIGLDDAKAAIHKLLIDPLKNPQAYLRYGIKAGGFILLEGPPGTGKTTFAKAAASELSVPFSEIDANALVDSYIGKTGKNIDRMFREARALAKKNGTPVVLFIDEIDYLAQKRGGENKTAAEAVPALIKQMDGFSTGSDDLVIIAATNIKNTLDPAILSRFGNVIHIPLPTELERAEILRSKLKMLDPADIAALDFSAAAKLSEGFSGRDLSKVALDLKSALAARDAGVKPIKVPLGRLLNELIEKTVK